MGMAVYSICAKMKLIFQSVDLNLTENFWDKLES